MKIFINYRRDDSAGYAGRLFDYLAAHFGEKNVFMDIDTIEPGEDFRKVVKHAVGTCDVVLVMIGKQWLNISDAQGRRRLDDPRDWVRLEIAAALANPTVRVIPVLVRDAHVPGENELPDDLKELAFRNAIELSDTRFHHDAGKLVQVIERIPVKLATLPARKQRNGIPARYLSLALILVGLGVITFVFMYGNRILGSLTSPTPAVVETSTSQPTSTLRPSPTSPPSFTPLPENIVSPAVEVVDLHFRSINDAVNKDDLIRSWDLMTINFQCNPKDNCNFPTYRDWWWKWHVVYQLYDCGPNNVIVQYNLVPREQPFSTSATTYFERYLLVEENGTLKMNEGNLVNGLDSNCTPVEGLQ